MTEEEPRWLVFDVKPADPRAALTIDRIGLYRATYVDVVVHGLARGVFVEACAAGVSADEAETRMRDAFDQVGVEILTVELAYVMD